MRNIEVLPLFPTALTITDFGALHTEEMCVLESFSMFTVDNDSNKTSADHHVLDHPGLLRLKVGFEGCFNHYMYDILDTCNDLKPNITQSWLNYTEVGERHKPHNHTNSFLSAVYYVKTDGEDFIQLDRPSYPAWSLCPNEYNEFNSTTWDVPSTTGSVIVFPSQLIHQVRTKMKDISCRISLACNMIPSGSIGGDHMLNLLKL
jgi:hypothetical protein